MFTVRVVLASLAALGVGACFDPTFHNPICGPAGDCPDGWQCAGGEGKACVSDGTEPGMPPDARPPAPGEPDAAPPACEKTWIPLLRNGNFEAGQVEWTQVPAEIQVIYQEGHGLPVTADGPGEWAALLGGNDNRQQVFSQTVAIPAGTERVRFRGSRCLATSETEAQVFDVFTIGLVRTNDDTAVLADFFSWSNRNGTASCRWQAEDQIRDVTNLPAQGVLRIFSKLDGGRVSTLYIDTLNLEVFACPPSSASAEVPER